MKKILFLVLLLPISTLLTACNKDSSTNSDDDNKLKSGRVISADNQFGLDLLMKENDPSKNLTISPTGISLALSMTYNGAEGNTRSQISNTLHKQGIEPTAFNQTYKDLSEQLAGNEGKTGVSIANAIFFNKYFDVKPDFLNTNQKYYQAKIEKCDFTNADETLMKVNGWVKEKTKGKIEKIISNVNTDDVIYLVNAIYFKGEWKYKFKNHFSTMNFEKANGQKVEPWGMDIRASFKYLSSSKLDMVELPYDGDKYSMLVMLPKLREQNISDIINEMKFSDLNNLIAKMTPQKVDVIMPKFEFSFSNSLKKSLISLGINDAFNQSKANFKAMSNDKVWISDVMHKTYIKVDDMGTEASAVTVVIGVTTSLGPTEKVPLFLADRPFMFAIRENNTGAFLFLGIVADPTQKE